MDRTITTEGVGRSEVTPDVLVVTLGVESRAATAADALARAGERIGRVIESLVGNGVERADIATTGLSLWPQYDDRGVRVVAHVAANSLTACIRDVSAAGAAIDAAARAAGDDARIHNVQFQARDTSEAIAAARTAAVLDAMERAKQLADAAGVHLGNVLTIDETAATEGPPSPKVRMMAASGPVPMEAGTQKVEIRVRAVFEIAG